LKKRWIFLIAAIALAVLCALAAVLMAANGYSITVGRCMTANGQFLLIDGTTPIVMEDRLHYGALFSDIADGDQILVLHDRIATTYPAQTGAYAVIRLSRGGLDDIPLQVQPQLAELGWIPPTQLDLPETVPEDFSFFLRWGCWGISSYDSKSGVLIKTSDATHPEDYVTEYVLSPEETENIYDMLRTLDINRYPAEYHPDPTLATSPAMTLVLTVRAGGQSRTVTCKNIALIYEASNKKGQAFLSACRDITDLLTATDAWQALPDYEFLYD